jgi:hypothetical protein
MLLVPNYIHSLKYLPRNDGRCAYLYRGAIRLLMSLHIVVSWRSVACARPPECELAARRWSLSPSHANAHAQRCTGISQSSWARCKSRCSMSSRTAGERASTRYRANQAAASVTGGLLFSPPGPLAAKSVTALGCRCCFVWHVHEDL